MKDLVTDEELIKMIKDSYEKNLKNPPLEEQSDEKLKELAQKLRAERKALRGELSDALNHYWDIKTLNHYWDIKTNMREKERLMKKALIIKGARKGRSCPAHKHQNSGTYRTEIACEARRGWQHFYDDDDLYRKYCSTCCLRPDTIKKRMTFKRVFETKGKSS